MMMISAEVTVQEEEVTFDGRPTPLDLPQQELFCQEYIKDFNGAGAAVRAGYAPKNAKSQANRLLTNVDLRLRVKYLVQRRAALTEIQQNRVVLELARVAFSNIGEVAQWGPSGLKIVPSDNLSIDTLAAIKSITVEETVLATMKNGDKLLKVKSKVDMHPKAPAYRLLSEHTGIIGKAADAEGKSVNVTLWSGRNRDD